MTIPWWGLLILFPTACALIGWITNVIAVKMIFRPREPWSLGGLRFQGVLPKHQDHFAHEIGEVVTSDLITTKEMVERLDVNKLYEALRPVIDSTFSRVVDDLRQQLTEPQRALLSDAVIDSLRKQVEKELEAELPAMAARVKEEADELVNITEMVADKVVAIGPAKLEELVYRAGGKEFKFIEYYGGVFGFVLGLVQFAVISVFPIRYSLPVVGLLVGTITNYLAIKMLFYPRQPKKLLFFKIQGLFPKRQQEIATELAKITVEDGFVVVDKVFQLLAERVLPRPGDRDAMDQYEALLFGRFPAIKAMLDSMLSAEQMEDFRQRLATHYVELMPEVTDALVREAAAQLDLKAILDHKVANLSKLRWENIIRGLFSQEEFYLVVYGGLLGAIMGGTQLGLLTLSNWGR